jgi:hypothetical protein
MEIETKERNEVTQEVNQFVNQHGNTGLKLDLLFFWKRYPYAKFTSGIIAHALHCNRRVDIEEALESFVKAMLIERHTRQGLPFYCLTADPEKRQWILSLSAYRDKLQITLCQGMNAR